MLFDEPESGLDPITTTAIGKLIMEMRDRLKDWQTTPISDSAASDKSTHPGRGPVDEALSALIALGYKPQEASRYVHAVAKDDMSNEQIIREALKASIKK